MFDELGFCKKGDIVLIPMQASWSPRWQIFSDEEKVEVAGFRVCAPQARPDEVYGGYVIFRKPKCSQDVRKIGARHPLASIQIL